MKFVGHGMRLDFATTGQITNHPSFDPGNSRDP
jgi:hypothetical protein